MKVLIPIFTASLLLASCGKQNLKQPTKVNFAFGIDKSGGSGSLVEIDHGDINLIEFQIDGDRIEGEDISFSRNWPGGLISGLNGSADIEELDFDLPQGEYSAIGMNFRINSTTDMLAMTMNGKYKPGGGPPYKIIFECDAEKAFTVQCQEVSEQSLVSLKKDQDRKIMIQLNPAYWFDGLTTDQWNNADITPQNGLDEIIINSSQNVGMYETVLDRMLLFNTAVITE